MPPTPAPPSRADVHQIRRAREVLTGHATVLPHPGPDGLAAGAIALGARREPASAAQLLTGGVAPSDRDAPLPIGPVIALDWGAGRILRSGLVVDHEPPEMQGRPHQVHLTSFAEAAPTCTAAIMRRVVPHAPSWLAAVGAIAELGRRGLRVPECAGADAEAVRELVPYVSVARRVPRAEAVAAALELLLESDGPRTALADERLERLCRARRDLRDAYDQAMNVSPELGDGVVLVRLSTPFDVHGLVASTWHRRAPRQTVVAANDGHRDGVVELAVRGAPARLPDALRAELQTPTAVPATARLGVARFGALVDELGVRPARRPRTRAGSPRRAGGALPRRGGSR